jgi:arsenate reductase (thioredoxin)
MRREAAVRISLIVTTWFLFLTVTQSLAQEHRPAQTSSAHAAKPPTVLFMCPHGAAKSVLASAYFQRLAKERGLNVRVDSAGTEPDATVAPAVAAHLERNGYAIPVAKPRKVTPREVAAADVVISIGCDLSGLPAPRGQLQRWDEVPALSEDFARADEAIRKRVTDLIDELVRAQLKR